MTPHSNRTLFHHETGSNYEGHPCWDVLSAPDAVMDPDVPTYIDNYITFTLKEQGWDSKRPDLPVSVTYPIEIEALSNLIRSFQGLGNACELIAGWCQELDDVYESLLKSMPDAGVIGNASGETFLKNANDVKLLVNENPENVCFMASDYLTEGLCLIFAQEFQPEPYKNILASQEGSWSPPAFYWALLKDLQVVETFKRLYDRHRGSEFLNAFLQDYCERRESLDDNFRVTSHKELNEITAHFSIFTKAFRELLVEFLTQDDLFEFGDDDPQNISNLLCHAENAYVYAQALLHFLPYSQPEFSSCRRLAQLTYRNLRRCRSEFSAADRLLLFTALPNYPDLNELFKKLQETETEGRMQISTESIVQISDALARVMRRFERHKTLLLFHDVSKPLPKIAEEEGEIEPLPQICGGQTWTWEVEMLADPLSGDAEGIEAPAEDQVTVSSVSPSNIIQHVTWPVAAEVKKKSQLGFLWNLPSASQAGDEKIIQEETQEESDRRGSTKLIMPPMQAIRETALLDQLWEILMCPNLPGQPTSVPVGKLIELILALSTISDYELVVMHLQHEQHEMENYEMNEAWDLNAANEEEGTSLDPLDEDFFEDEFEEGDYEISATPQTNPTFYQNYFHGQSMPSDYSNVMGSRSSGTEGSRNWPPTVGCRTVKVRPDKAGKIWRKRSTEEDFENPQSVADGEMEDEDKIDEKSPLAEDSPANKDRKRPRIAASVVSSYMARSHVPSVLESHVYLDPHEGARLRAFRPNDPEQSARLRDMFNFCAERREIYLGKARKDLFELFYIVREPRPMNASLPDLIVYKLLARCNTSAGASAVLMFVKDVLCISDDNFKSKESAPYVDPILNVTPAIVTLLTRMCIQHPRKRILVVALCKALLEKSFTEPTSSTSELSQIKRRKVLSIAIAQVGFSHAAPAIPPEDLEVMPWRAIEVDWGSIVIPGYKLLFHLIQELLYCFDLTLLRDTLEFLTGVCAPPFSTPFSESLCNLLSTIISKDYFDFKIPLNSNLKQAICGFLENIYGSWAPSSPPDKVLLNCQKIAEKLELPPEQMPIVGMNGFPDSSRQRSGGSNGMGGESGTDDREFEDEDSLIGSLVYSDGKISSSGGIDINSTSRTDTEQ